MALELADIPSFSGPRPAGAQPARRPLPKHAPRWPRRRFIQVTAATGTGLGLAALGLLPPARSAQAGNLDIYTGPCPSYAAGHNCSPGCGPSTVCTDCCTPSCGTPCTCSAWFRNGGNYRYRPGQCIPGSNVWDGWVWKYNAPCGCCNNNITYRCHDGSKLINGSWSPRICRSVIGCGICNCN